MPPHYTLSDLLTIASLGLHLGASGDLLLIAAVLFVYAMPCGWLWWIQREGKS